MLALKLFLCVLPICVFCEETKLLDPCDVTDIECLSKSTQKFLKSTSKGIPQYDIRAIDPLIISSFDFSPFPGAIAHFKDLKVTGLENQTIHDFKMNTEAKDVNLTTKADITVVAEHTPEVKNKNLPSVTLRASATVLGTAQYNYNIKKNDKGIEHFDVGPETITCHVDGEVQLSTEPDILEIAKKDNAIKEEYEKYIKQQSELRKSLICEVVKEAYKSVVHNIRASAKLLPKTAFFKNI